MVTLSDKSFQVINWVLKIGVFGIFLMPYIGYLDIIVAVSVLIKPLRIILIWAIFWAFLTALMRPIAGGSILDFVERAGNWATPLALLLLINWKEK
jgi:hypothetical protein